MNHFLIKTEYLATGQLSPFTGEWVNTSLCRNGFIVIYASGSNVDINLQAKTQLSQSSIFMTDEANAITFYNITGVGPGYADPIFFDSPISHIRLEASNGNAPVFSYITYQN